MRGLSLCALTFLAACGSPEASREEGSYPKIVGLNPCTDAILAEFVGQEQLLAISHYSHNPKSSSMDVAKARQYASTDGSVEEILALQPDVVVAGSFLSPATRQALDDLDIRIETFGITNSVADSKAQIANLAELSGQQDGGDALIAQIDRAMTRSAAQGDAVRAVLWQPAGIVPGEGTLVSELMRHTGFTSHSAAMGLGQADYLSLEQMLANPPDVLLVAGRERSQRHPALDRLDDMHQADLDTSLLYCGGPTIMRALERLSDIKADVKPSKTSANPSEGWGLMQSKRASQGERPVEGGPRLRGDSQS